MVHLNTEGESIYGNVMCIVCIREKCKTTRLKRVSYYQSPETNYWVLSNFKKHLENIHLFTASRSIVKRKKNKTKTKEKHSSDKIITDSNDDLDCESASIHSEEVIIFEELTCVEDNNNQSPSLYARISNQLTHMVSAVLINGEGLHLMDSQLKQMEYKNVSIIKIKSDGNCLFSAIAHQLFRNPIASAEHKKCTSEIRAIFVEHILQPENFPDYFIALVDRVDDLKNQSTNDDMEMECKMYARHVLSKPGKWGGLETILAVSNIYNVSVVIFNEQGPCYVVNGKKQTNDRVIMIAYRLGLNEKGEQIHNHYDSVVDIDADTVFSTVEYITKK